MLYCPSYFHKTEQAKKCDKIFFSYFKEHKQNLLKDHNQGSKVLINKRLKMWILKENNRDLSLIINKYLNTLSAIKMWSNK